jgi:hypothetical protein
VPILLPIQEPRIEAHGGEQCPVGESTMEATSSLTAERQPPQMSLFDQGVKMLLDSNRRCRLVQDEADLYVSKLRCLSEIRRPDERPLPIDHDAFRKLARGLSPSIKLRGS